MVPILYEHPNMDFESILTNIRFKQRSIHDLLAPVDYLIEKFKKIQSSQKPDALSHWIMGQLYELAIGNISLKLLKEKIDSRIQRNNKA